jgi:hypothetical protein
MKCNYCGADNKETSKFCASCGAELKEKKKTTKKEEVEVEKVEVKEVKTEPVKTTTDKVTDGKATASLVLGICSLIIWCLTFPLSLVGLILGIASKEKSGKRTAGIVINAIALFFSVICAVICFWFWAAIGTAIDEVNRNGNFEDFFETLEREIEKAEDEDYVRPTVPTLPDTEDEKTKVVGTDHYGYVKVPENWIVFHDVDNDSVYQYTDIGELGYIVTLQTYEEDIAPYTAATNIKNSVVSEGNEATIKTAIIGKYVAYKVECKYTDGTYLDAYLFKADGKLRYVSIEGPDNTNDNFKIPTTYSVEK